MDVGSHHELLERCTKYQELIKRQSLMYKAGTESVDSEAKNSRGEGVEEASVELGPANLPQEETA